VQTDPLTPPIEESDEHSENADSPIRESLEPDSNVTVESDSQSRKQLSHTDSTDDGIQIDESDEQLQNAESPRHASREPDSNVTIESDSQSRKQLSHTDSTDDGIQIDESDGQL
jgi:hypothetical protein